MEWDTLLSNVLSPAALFFFLGFAAVLVRSDLEIPHPLPRFFSTYLLIAIGYQGGAKLAHAGFTSEIALYVAGAMLMAVAVPFATFFVLRRILNVYDAAAMAATYGSVSIVTFIVASDFLAKRGIESGGYMVALMSLMETPAIVAGILLVQVFARREDAPADWRKIAHESLFNGTVFLLLGSLAIGVLTGNAHAKSLDPFMVGLFKGMVLLFLLDTGMLAARRARELMRVGPSLVAFGVVAPVVSGLAGVGLARAMGMGAGDALLFAVLCASSSYIVVPAAMRQAVPQANPGLFELLSLSVTFPFNLAVGIPVLFAIVQRVWGA